MEKEQLYTCVICNKPHTKIPPSEQILINLILFSPFIIAMILIILVPFRKIIKKIFKKCLNKIQKKQTECEFTKIYAPSFNGNISDLDINEETPLCYCSNGKFFIKNQNKFKEITFDSNFNFEKFKTYSIYTISVVSLSACHDDYYKVFKILLPINKNYKDYKNYKDKNLTEKFKFFCQKNIETKNYMKKFN